MLRLLSNKSGMSLVEIMVAAGILGVISVSALKLMENQNQTIRRFSNKSDQMEAYTMMRYVLSSQQNCTNSLRGTVVDTDGSDITISTGSATFEPDPTDSKKRVKIISMKLKIDDSSGIDDRMAGNVEIVFLREKFKITKNVPVNLELEESSPSNWVVRSCRSVDLNIVEQARADACKAMGGTVDITTNPIDERRCILACPYNLADGTLKANSDTSWPTNLANLVLSDNNFVISLACLKAREIFYENTFVNTSGDTINGSLTVQGQLRSNTRICVDGRCRTFSDIKCDKPGDRLTGINEDGTPQCDRFLVEGTCKPGEYVSGIKANGEPECAEIPYVERDDCPAGKFLAGVNPDGSLNCRTVIPSNSCPKGKVVTGIKSSGELECDY